MRAEYINPFIDAAMNVIKTMANIDVVAGKPGLKTDNRSFGDVTGVIGLAGFGISGNLVVSFEASCILKVVNAMLGCEMTELSDDVVDAVGEITNMICGNTKRDLNKLGISIQMATPMILRGQSIEISQLSQAPVITIPFTTEAGKFCIDANLYSEEDEKKKSSNKNATSSSSNAVKGS